MWLLDCPALFDRPGNPYHDADGHAWADNAERFMLLCRVGALLAEDAFDLGWRPEVVHCNDWQSALVPLLLHARRPRPALVFTIHNLAYQGLFPREDFERLGIAPHYWHPDALEFHGQFQLHQGRHRVRRPRDHGEPQLCARDPDARNSATASTGCCVTARRC